MSLFLGLDGGATKTACAVGDATSVIATAMSGGSNPVRVGAESARESIQAAIREVCREAQVTPAEITSSCIGVAGVTVPEVKETVQKAVGELTGSRVEVVGDMEIALEAAFAGGPGVVVMAGSGSIVFGRNERGETARAGGWGAAVSDEGSGYWIGRMAVTACLRAHDGGLNTALPPYVMNTWHIGSRDDMVRIANALPPPDFAGLFPQVLAAADAGDLLAEDILARAGSELAELAYMVIRRLWPSRQGCRVATGGGVFQNSSRVRQSFQRQLEGLCPQTELLEDPVQPVMGALFLARKAETQTPQASTSE